MQNDLLGNILNNIVMQKVIRDKITIQQKQQQEQQKRQAQKQANDEYDEYDDEQTKQIMKKIKQQRLKIIQQQKNKKQYQISLDQYRQVISLSYVQIKQDQFLNSVTKYQHTVVHFYHKDFERCKILDKHLQILCHQFPSTQFLYLNAQKSPFFVNKLHIRTLPTLCIFIDGIMKDKIIGFQGFSGDQFLTSELALRLSYSGVIDYHPNKNKSKIILKGQPQGNIGDGQFDNEKD